MMDDHEFARWAHDEVMLDDACAWEACRSVTSPPHARLFCELHARLVDERDSRSLTTAQRTLAAHGRALAFILAGITKQPAQITGLQELLDELGREMPGNIIPASGLVGS